MFYISKLDHTLPLPPHLLSLPLAAAIKEELENKFLDKVIANLGLCISVYDIQSIEGGFIFPGDGCSTYKVIFRLIMFRPFIGEIITGKVEESNATGLRLSLGFFSDIYVPSNLLRQPCRLGEDGLWIWTYGDDELPIDVDEKICFRVNGIRYPPIPYEQDENAKPYAPMEIIADIDEDGLGMVAWWQD